MMLAQSSLVLLLLAPLITGCAGPRAFTADDRAAVGSVLERQAAAWNRGDLAGYMDGYLRSEALVFTSGAKVRRGWQAAFDHYQARYGTDRAGMGTLAFAVLSVDPVGADGAIVLGSWKLTGTPQAGGGIFTVVLARGPDGWRIVHDHTSSEP